MTISTVDDPLDRNTVNDGETVTVEETTTVKETTEEPKPTVNINVSR